MGHPFCFWIAGTLAILTALGVILARSPLYSALSLAATLLSTAVLFISLQAHLAGAVQVMVYAGAILVLIVFTVMLLNLRGDSGEKPLRPAAAAAGMVVCAAFFLGLTAFFAVDAPTPPAVGPEFGTAGAIGRLLFAPGSRFVYAFELVSVLLLAALVGAIALGRPGPEQGKDAAS